MKTKPIFQKIYMTDRPTDRPTDIAASRVAFTRLKKRAKKRKERETEKIVAKALDGQRYPLPQYECMWMCEGERGSGRV